jgi:transglutaminase-like putative cysteine protease
VSLDTEIVRIASLDEARCTPVPAWVERRPHLPQTSETEVHCIANGICRLLSDTQVDLRGTELAWHSRTAQRILTREGAERASHFVAEFDPAYQRIDVHFIQVLRGEEPIEHAAPSAFQVFRRESNLERLALNGRLTVSLLIPDVRVGDIVEVGLTVYGSTPVLGGRYAAWAGFDSFNPWLESRHRLIRPLSRKIFVKAFNNPPEPDITTSDDVEDSRWQIVGQKRLEAEELTPPWLVLVPALQFSEFGNWSEVASLFAPFYKDSAIPETLVEEIDRLSKAHESQEERAAEWLRFVQQKLRYFAFSLGEGGLMPRELEAIWSTRFGDCKDATKLYIAGARRMGLDACAALVSTTHGPALNEFVPSPGVFNHCIVRLCLNGVSYWLDPTIQTQSGSLPHIFQPHAGWALPLTQDTARLEKMGSDEPLHVLHSEEDLSVGPKRDSPAKLRRHIDYFFWAADAVRNRIANEGAAEYARTILKELQSVWPGAVEMEPMEIRDDQAKNCLTLILSFEIRDCWKQADDGKRLSFSIIDTVITGSELNPLRGTPRRAEIYLGRPRKITRFLHMDMPRAWAGTGWLHEAEAPGVKFFTRLRIYGPTITNSKELVVTTWSIPAAQARAYGEVVKSLRENLLNIYASERFGKLRPMTVGRVSVGARLAAVMGGGFRIVWLILVVLWLIGPLLRMLAKR